MRRAIAVCAVAAVSMVGAAACSSDDSTGISGGTPELTLVPDPTAPAPGSCGPIDEQIPAPHIVIDGERTEATFGVGTFDCATITGDGYIINNFNPVLLDADQPVIVELDGEATPSFTWSIGEPFTQSGPGTWVSAEPATGCARLTIQLTSPSGGSNATYGADIRVGGEDVACAQRDLDPADPGVIVPGLEDSVPARVTTDTEP